MQGGLLSLLTAIGGLLAGGACGWLLRAAVAKNRQRRLETKLSAHAQSYTELRERFDDLVLHKAQFARKEDAARGHLLMAMRRIERLQEELARLRLVCASPGPERPPESGKTRAPMP